MIPFRFGDPSHQRFGILHPPQGADRGQAVVLCNPFGQEAIRCHRMMRVLGERLARAGFAVMRFDYFATGDSDGDDAAGDLEAWVEDVTQARDEAARRSGCARVSLFGLRLGATLAALASERVAPPRRLVLWDPVIHGPSYLAELARYHAIEAEDERDVIEPPREDATAAGGEILGFPISARLRGQLAQLSGDSLARARADSVAVIRGAAAPGLESLRAALVRASIPLREQIVATRVVWASDDAMNSAYVPIDALQAIVAMVTEER